MEYDIGEAGTEKRGRFLGGKITTGFEDIRGGGTDRGGGFGSSGDMAINDFEIGLELGRSFRSSNPCIKSLRSCSAYCRDGFGRLDGKPAVIRDQAVVSAEQFAVDEQGDLPVIERTRTLVAETPFGGDLGFDAVPHDAPVPGEHFLPRLFLKGNSVVAWENLWLSVSLGGGTLG